MKYVCRAEILDSGVPCCVSTTGTILKQPLAFTEITGDVSWVNGRFLETDPQLALDDAERYLLSHVQRR